VVLGSTRQFRDVGYEELFFIHLLCAVCCHLSLWIVQKASSAAALILNARPFKPVDYASMMKV